MNNAQMLIERLRKKVPSGTNYAIAQALEMDPSSLKAVIDGKYGLGTKAVIRLHELLGMDTRDLLVMIEEDKAKSAKDKDFWGRRSPRITAASLIAGLALGAVVTFMPRTASAGYKASCNATRYTLCAVRRFVLTFIKSLFSTGYTVSA